MRRIGMVGILLVAISSFLALQAMCRPFILCIERKCEIDGRVATSLEACVAQTPLQACASASGCRDEVFSPGDCQMDELDDMDCGGRHVATDSPRPCMPNFDFTPAKTCCESKDLPTQSGKCPRRVMSCIYCIPARFIWEPAPLNAVRQSDGVNRPAILATIAMIEADHASRMAHAHSPPPAEWRGPAPAGFDRRIAICSFLL